jgi:hypothetical protein
MGLVMTMKSAGTPPNSFFLSRPFFVIDKADSEIVVGLPKAVALIIYAGTLNDLCAIYVIATVYARTNHSGGDSQRIDNKVPISTSYSIHQLLSASLHEHVPSVFH